MSNKAANRLISEQSPYLLQHAYNPVDWYAWGEEAWEKARRENKLVIISIGYSACHWCHVMEHQSFEQDDVATLMNQYFVSIKVDREERPDIDAVYMEAVQLMTGRGGWPLNCIALPDGRPVYGGTYFPKEAWMNVLDNIQQIFVTDPQKVEEYAQRLHKGLRDSELVKINAEPDQKTKVNHQNIIQNFVSAFDPVFGGPHKAPKFPMPCNYEFLLNYGIIYENKIVQDHVRLTLEKMALGGIFDQLGGGFARYSVDAQWKVPHFEKMLYDNGQLVSLYAKAYAFYKADLFKETAEKTIAFMQAELQASEGIYYSALDADSEGEEGKFYVWKKEELEQILSKDEMDFATAYYSINDFGFWEHGNYVLIREFNDEEIMKRLSFDRPELLSLRKAVNEKLLHARAKRVRPGLDDKALLSWNATVLKGLAEAAMYLGNEKYMNEAVKLYRSMEKCFCDREGQWYRSYKNEKQAIPAFAEDLALLTDALLALYEACFDKEYLHIAMRLLFVLDRDFFDAEHNMYFFTSHSSSGELIVRRTEIFDNVIPSPNSVMAAVLYRVGTLMGHDEMIERSGQMLESVSRYFENAPQALAGWLNAWLLTSVQQKEMVVVGEKFMEAVDDLRQNYQPLTVWCAAASENGLPLLASRLVKDKTTIYECRNKACNLPVQYQEKK